MTQTFKVEFSKKVPIVEVAGAKWMVDTGSPYSYPNPVVDIKGNMASPVLTGTADGVMV